MGERSQSVRRSLSFPDAPLFESSGSGRYTGLRAIIGCVSAFVSRRAARPFIGLCRRGKWDFARCFVRPVVRRKRSLFARGASRGARRFRELVPLVFFSFDGFLMCVLRDADVRRDPRDAVGRRGQRRRAAGGAAAPLHDALAPLAAPVGRLVRLFDALGAGDPPVAARSSDARPPQGARRGRAARSQASLVMGRSLLRPCSLP